MVQHFILELASAALAAPIRLHCVGPATGAFVAPPVVGGSTWYSVRDTPTEVRPRTMAQASRQVLPAIISADAPLAVTLTFNGVVILHKTVTSWSYNDREHLCFLSVTASFQLECGEMDERPRMPFVKYWRDLAEPRYVVMMKMGDAFFTPARLTLMQYVSEQ